MYILYDGDKQFNQMKHAKITGLKYGIRLASKKGMATSFRQVVGLQAPPRKTIVELKSKLF